MGEQVISSPDVLNRGYVTGKRNPMGQTQAFYKAAQDIFRRSVSVDSQSP
jgi:hypothetical protein